MEQIVKAVGSMSDDELSAQAGERVSEIFDGLTRGAATLAELYSEASVAAARKMLQAQASTQALYEPCGHSGGGGGCGARSV